MTEPYLRARPLRGLLLRVRSGDFDNHKYCGTRRLVGLVDKSIPPGNCVWCGRPTVGRRTWHDDCVEAYFVTIGTEVEPLGGTRSCAECGKRLDLEIDHRYPLALSRVHQQEGRRGWWKAWTRENLQWLCGGEGGCHTIKTRLDVARISFANRQIKKRLKEQESGVMELPF